MNIREKFLKDRLINKQEELEAVQKQLSQTLSNQEEVKLKRQADHLLQEIEEIDAEIQALQTRLDTQEKGKSDNANNDSSRNLNILGVTNNASEAGVFTSGDISGVLANTINIYTGGGNYNERIEGNYVQSDKYVVQPPENVVAPTTPFYIYIVYQNDKELKIDSYSFPYSDIKKNSDYSRFLALLNQLPNLKVQLDTASVFRLRDEVVLSITNLTDNATDNANTGVIIIPQTVLEDFKESHLAFTYIKSYIDTVIRHD